MSEPDAELDSTEADPGLPEDQPEPEGAEQNRDYPNGDTTTEEADDGRSVG